MNTQEKIYYACNLLLHTSVSIYCLVMAVGYIKAEREAKAKTKVEIVDGI